MSLKILAVVIVFIIALGFALSLPEISPLYKIVNTVSVSTGYNMQTSTSGVNYKNGESSTQLVSNVQPVQSTINIQSINATITVEEYKTKRIMVSSSVSEEVKESKRNVFKEKLLAFLQNHNITLMIRHILKIYNNDTNTLIYSREFNFTNGCDRTINIYFDNSTLPLTSGTILRIEVYHYIKLVIPLWNLTFERTISNVKYTTVTDNDSSKPNVKLTGVLTQTEKGVALKVDYYKWYRTWDYGDMQSVFIYLRVNGSAVTDLEQLNQFGTFSLGDNVEVEGILSRDIMGNFWLDVIEMELTSEYSLQT